VAVENVAAIEAYTSAASTPASLIRSRSTRSRVCFDFAAGRATGWLRLANDDSLAADAPAFPACDSSSVDFVLRTSSLRAEWDVRIPVFVPSSRATAQLRARVSGVEPSRSRSRSRSHT